EAFVPMAHTPISLLERLSRQPDSASWQRLIDLYTPLIRTWLRSYSLQQSDIDDLSQDVLGVLVKELPGFQHNQRAGAFRRWLRRITVNRLRGFWRARLPQAVGTGTLDAPTLDQLEDPDSLLSQRWDEEHDRHVVSRLLELLEPEFEPTTWHAFRQLMLEGKTTSEVAADLGITPNAARIAKSRVLSRFRKEIEGLVD
ncbi:MAG: RNA polymerase sigma factor, partial [Gemmataceae bacterium]